MKRLGITPQLTRWSWSTPNILQAENNLEDVRSGLITREMQGILVKNQDAYR
jgi:hypothetical protein